MRKITIFDLQKQIMNEYDLDPDEAMSMIFSQPLHFGMILVLSNIVFSHLMRLKTGVN